MPTPGQTAYPVPDLDADLIGLSTLDSSAGLVEQTGAATFTKRAIGVGASTSVPTRADADARYDAAGAAAAAQAASQPLNADLTTIANGTTPYLLRPWVSVSSFGAQPNVAAASFATTGLTDTSYALTSSAGATILYKNGGKKLMKCVAPATTDGSVLAGLQPVSNNSALISFHADARWTLWCIHRSDSVLTYMRNGQTGVYASGTNPADAATGAANYAAIRWEADGSIVLAVAQGSTQSTSTIAAAGTIAVDTTYISRLRWDGATLYGTYAVVAADGTIGAWATEKTLATNIPANTLVFNVQERFFQVSSGGSARNWILGPFYAELAFTTS